MDEFIPEGIRDSYWFMFPIFFVLYRGKDIKRKMQFKTLAYSLPEPEMNALYKEVDIISRNRKTDLSESNIKYVLNRIEDGRNILDAGCGKGFLLNRIRQVHPDSKLNGLDLENQLEYRAYSFHQWIPDLASLSGSIIRYCYLHPYD